MTLADRLIASAPAPETVAIRMVRYRTPTGVPTCAADIEAGHQCHFAGTRGFGMRDVCLWPTNTGIPPDLRRSEGGRGYLVPGANCPVWDKEATPW